jgi:uroporphyrinogen-III decarboxylase
MLLSVDQYEADRRERTQRRERAARFEEPDRIPVCFGIGGSYHCWLQGVNISEYYAQPELQVEVQLAGIQWEYEYLRADSCTRDSVGYEGGPVGEAIVFGAEVQRPDGTSPRIVHCCESLEDVLRLRVPRPEDNPRLKEHIAQAERFVAAAHKIGAKLQCGVPKTVGIHPPLSALCALMDPTEVYAAMYTEPERLRAALDRMFEAFVTYREYGAEPGALQGGPFGLADDNISQISADMFCQWEMPYYLKFRRRYRPSRFGLHTDGPNDQHFKTLADEVKLNSMDIGGFSSLAAAVRHMKGKVHIHGGLQCQDFYSPDGMTEATRRKALDAMSLAGPGGGFELAIGGECYVGVSPRGIRELVELVEKYGRYPLRVEDFPP